MLLVYLDVVAPLIAILLCLFIKRIRFIKSDLILLIFLLSQVFFNGLANILQYNQVNNHWIYHCNCFFTQLLFTYYFYSLVIADRVIRKIVVITLCCFLVFFFVNLIFIQSYTSFNSYSYSIGAFFLCAYTYFGFQDLMNYKSDDNIFDLKSFWCLSGVLIYFGSSLLIFLSYNYLSIVSYDNVGILWRIHNIFFAIGCIFFFKSINSKIWIRK
jgi:hypothetical protein